MVSVDFTKVNVLPIVSRPHSSLLTQSYRRVQMALSILMAVATAAPRATAVQGTPHTTTLPSSNASAAPHAPASATIAKPAANCNPPFTIDAEGHKIFKKECL